MALFEMLYGHRCQTQCFGIGLKKTKVVGPDILQVAEIQVRRVRKNLKISPSR
jgi:hypothetical protein